MLKKNKKSKDTSVTYSMYNSSGMMMYKMLEKRGLVKKVERKDSLAIWDSCTLFNAKIIPNYFSSTNHTVNSYESLWASEGFKTIFVEDLILVSKLHNAKYENATADSIKIPVEGDFVSISFPNGIVIDNVKLESCLIGIFNEGDYARKSDANLERLFKRAVIRKEHFDKNDMMISIVVQSNINGESVPITSRIKLSDSIKLLNEEKFLDFYEQQSEKELAWNGSCITNASLDQEDIHKICVYLRTCLGLFLYLDVLPNSLRCGLPEGSKRIQNTKYDYRPQTVEIHKDLSNSGPRIHFRCGHYRELIADRFFKNEDGSSRKVYVRSTIVGLGGSDNIDTKVLENIFSENNS